MQRAKAFFYVSLGILALAGAFQLWTNIANSQILNEISAADIACTGTFLSTANGDVYLASHSFDGSTISWSPRGHINTISPIVAIENNRGTFTHAYASNGDYFRSTNSGATWEFGGNVFGAPVQATETTWGRIKADRR